MFPRTPVLRCWLALLVLLLSTAIVKAQSTAPTVVRDASGFSFSVPAGFTVMPEVPAKDPMVLYAYKRTNDAGQLVELLAIEKLKGVIGRESLDASIPAGFKGRLLKAKWEGFDIDVFELPETLSDAKFVTYNAQVPLKPFAIQVKVFGADTRKTELRALLDVTLAGVEGPSNWIRSIMPASISNDPKYGTYLMVLLVVLIVMGLVLLFVLGRKTPRETVLAIAAILFMISFAVPRVPIRELLMISGGLRMFSILAFGLGIVYYIRGGRQPAPTGEKPPAAQRSTGVSSE